MAIQPYNFKGATPIEAAGSMILYQSSGSADSGRLSSVVLYVDGTRYCVMQPGDRVKLTRPGSSFRIEPVFDAGLTGTMLIGDGDVIPAAGGVLEVVDASIRQSRDGDRVWGSYVRAGQATTFAGVCLFAEGADAYAIRALQVGVSGGACPVKMFVTTTAVPTPVGNRLAKNKLLGETADALRLFSFDAATASASAGEAGTIDTDLGLVYLANNNPVTLPLTSPLIMSPGMGLAFIAQSVNFTVNVCFDAERIPAATLIVAP